MKQKDLINKKITIAEKRILELIKSGSLKNLSEKSRHQIVRFYERKSLSRLETAGIIYKVSKESHKITGGVSQDYADYSEVVAAAYYAMYYIVHAYLAHEYKTKLQENVRGVHAITQYILLYYLVKTKKLAEHFYEEYMNTLETTAEIQKLSVEDFQKEAYGYVERYDKSRSAREIFTYNVTRNAEAYHAEKAMDIAKEFISTIRQLMLPK